MVSLPAWRPAPSSACALAVCRLASAQPSRWPPHQRRWTPPGDTLLAACAPFLIRKLAPKLYVHRCC